MADPLPSSPAPSADPLEARVRRSWTLLAGAIAVLAGLVLALGHRPGHPAGRAPSSSASAVSPGRQPSPGGASSGATPRGARRSTPSPGSSRDSRGPCRPTRSSTRSWASSGPGTGADHLVVVRRRPGAPILDATLVPMRPGAPSASTVLPAVDLDDGMPPSPWNGSSTDGRPAGGIGSARGIGPAAARRGRGVVAVGPGRRPAADVADRAAERIAARVRRAFGLTNVLSAPLVAHGELLGAIVISRRRDTPWPEAARRLLDAAAAEASAALARTVAHRAAEAAATTDALTGLPEPALLRGVRGAAGQGPPGGRHDRDPDGRRRPLQAPQRPPRSRRRRRRPARRRPHDRGHRARRRPAGPLRRRGVRGPPPQPQPGRRAGGRRAHPRGGRADRPRVGRGREGHRLGGGDRRRRRHRGRRGPGRRRRPGRSTAPSASGATGSRRPDDPRAVRYSARWPSTPRSPRPPRPRPRPARTPRRPPLERRAGRDLRRDRQPPRDQGRARLQDGRLPPGRRRDRPQPARHRPRLPRGSPAGDPRRRVGDLRQDRRDRGDRAAGVPRPAPRRGPADPGRAPRDPGRRAEDGAPALGAARDRDARRPADRPARRARCGERPASREKGIAGLAPASRRSTAARRG